MRITKIHSKDSNHSIGSNGLSRLSSGFIILLLLLILVPAGALAGDFNPRTDYYYDFSNSDAKIVSVEIYKNRLVIPELGGSYHTAFLEIDIRPAPLSRLIEPKVKLFSQEIYRTQYFEYGAKGIRYINVSDFIRSGCKGLELSFDQCYLREKEVRLILFENPEIEKENLVVLAPHPDDAEIAAYGLYASNKESFVVTVTVGDAGKKMYDELYADDTLHYLKKADIRLWNSITVPLMAGLDPQNIVNLGYFDASLKQMFMDKSSQGKARYTGITSIDKYRSGNISSFLDSIPARPDWNSLVNDLKQIIETRNPTVIVTPYPAIDVHSDHKCTTLALLQALKELDYLDLELWLYTNHFTEDGNYPVGKVRSLISLPPNPPEKNLFFNRICSFPLSDVMQSDKTLALEAMNPLRPDTEWHTTRGARKLYRKIRKENIRNNESDYYYRRAVRNNELFFIVDMEYLLNDTIYNLITGDMNFK